MKFVKVLSAVATVAILSACSHATAKMEQKTAGAMASITDRKSVV